MCYLKMFCLVLEMVFGEENSSAHSTSTNALQLSGATGPPMLRCQTEQSDPKVSDPTMLGIARLSCETDLDLDLETVPCPTTPTTSHTTPTTSTTAATMINDSYSSAEQPDLAMD